MLRKRTKKANSSKIHSVTTEAIQAGGEIFAAIDTAVQSHSEEAKIVEIIREKVRTIECLEGPEIAIEACIRALAHFSNRLRRSTALA